MKTLMDNIERYLFVATTPMHMFTIERILNMKRTQGHMFTADLAVLAQFDNSREYAEALKKSELIDNYDIWESYYKTGPVEGIKCLLSYCFSLNRVKEEFLKNASSLGNRDYSKIFVPYPSKFALDLYDFVAKDAAVALYDDGIWTYNGKIFDHFAFNARLDDKGSKKKAKSGFKRIIARILNIFTNNHYLMDVDEIYCYTPKNLGRKLAEDIEIHSIINANMRDSILLTDARSSPSNNLTNVLFLGTVEEEIKNCSEMQDKIFILLSKYFGSDFSFRPHPRDKNVVYWREKGVSISDSTELWEVLCCNGKIGDQSVLVGYGSSGLITPKIIFDLEPYVISLHKMVESTKTDFNATDCLFCRIKNSYKKPEKVIMPSSLIELDACLQALCHVITHEND